MQDFPEWLASKGFDHSTLTADQKTALSAAWRATEGGAQAGGDDPTLAKYIRENPGSEEHIRAAHAGATAAGSDPRAVELAMLRATRAQPRSNFTAFPADRPAVGAQSDLMTAGVLMAVGVDDNRVARTFGDMVAQTARDRGYNRLGLHSLLRMQLQAAGQTCSPGRLGESEIRDAMRLDSPAFRAGGGVSTISTSGILSNVANKSIAMSYAATATTWQRFSKRTPLRDFKPATVYRLTADLEYMPLAPGGEIDHGTLGEESATVTASTKARMLGLDRRDIINDDLSAFEQIPAMLGRNGAILVDKAVYSALLANANNFFGTGNKNLSSGGGSALGDAGLTAAEKLFMEQVDAGGNPTLIQPAILLTPPALAPTGRKLLADQPFTGGSSAAPSANPWARAFELVQSPWLSEAVGLDDNADDASWYLFAAAGDFSPVVVGFLDGIETPTIEDAEMDFSKLGMQWRGYHDVGVSLFEYRGGVLSVGA